MKGRPWGQGGGGEKGKWTNGEKGGKKVLPRSLPFSFCPLPLFAFSPLLPDSCHSLSRYSITSLVGTTSPYLEPMSKMLASCGSWARSPTASNGTIGRKPCASASITVARTQPLVVQPVTISVS